MDYTQVVNEIFQKYLGRQPNPYEINGFTQAMQNNYLDPIGLTMFLQSTAEYQKAQAPQIAQQYADQMTGLQRESTQKALGQGFDEATSRYARMGRPDSTGLGSSFAQVAGQVAADNSRRIGDQVGGYLGNVYGGVAGQQQGYGQNYAGNYGAYQNYVNNSNLLNQKKRNDLDYLYQQQQYGGFGKRDLGPLDYLGAASSTYGNLTSGLSGMKYSGLLG